MLDPVSSASPAATPGDAIAQPLARIDAAAPLRSVPAGGSGRGSIVVLIRGGRHDYHPVVSNPKFLGHDLPHAAC